MWFYMQTTWAAHIWPVIVFLCGETWNVKLQQEILLPRCEKNMILLYLICLQLDCIWNVHLCCCLSGVHWKKCSTDEKTSFVLLFIANLVGSFVSSNAHRSEFIVLLMRKKYISHHILVWYDAQIPTQKTESIGSRVCQICMKIAN